MQQSHTRDFIAYVLHGLVSIAALLSCVLGPAQIASAQPVSPYIPSANEIERLLDRAQVELSDSGNDGWDDSYGYLVTLDNGQVCHLFISARILTTSAEARRFYDEMSDQVLSGNERTDASKSPNESRRLDADESLSVRLIFTDPDLGRRQSDYASLYRFGRVVTLIETIGETSDDDAGGVDGARDGVLQRTVDLIAGKVHFYPADPVVPMAALAPYARTWNGNGVSLDIDATGRGEMRWRTNRWCQEDPTPPCDRMDGDHIDVGGGAALVLFRVDGPSAYGVVIGTTDTDKLPLGAVSLSIGESGTVQISQYGQVSRLCAAKSGDDPMSELHVKVDCGA